MGDGGVENAIDIFKSSLHARRHKVPDIQQTQKHRCKLTRSEYGQRFSAHKLNTYFAAVFESLPILMSSRGVQLDLSRYDLFHGHLFVTPNNNLGMLMHAKEYPYWSEDFPVNLGFCQTGSPVEFTDHSMDSRNILWLALPSRTTSGYVGALCILDAQEDGWIRKNLVMRELDVLRTIDESDFGHVIGDVNYFRFDERDPGKRIFVFM